VAGLALSTLILCTGLLLGALSHQPIPSRVSGYRQIFTGLASWAPSSFFSLGILMLIATPVMRVVASMMEFVSRRDWLYVLITSLVLLILTVGVVTGLVWGG
jgi:uncharacterized membrane protein